jgi:hypothetical protein
MVLRKLLNNNTPMGGRIRRMIRADTTPRRILREWVDRISLSLVILRLLEKLQRLTS